MLPTFVILETADVHGLLHESNGAGSAAAAAAFDDLGVVVEISADTGREGVNNHRSIHNEAAPDVHTGRGTVDDGGADDAIAGLGHAGRADQVNLQVGRNAVVSVDRGGAGEADGAGDVNSHRTGAIQGEAASNGDVIIAVGSSGEVQGLIVSEGDRSG